MAAMNQRLSAAVLILCSAAVVGSAQDLPPNIATLGMKELAYEVPIRLRVGGGGTTSYSLGANGTDVYRVYRTEPGMTALVGSDIYVIDAQDAKPRKLVSDGSHPAWSPDGSELAYCTWKGLLFGQIEVVKADGTGRRQLTNMRGGACFPDWSPDGTKIAFTALSVGASEKNLMGAKNTEIFVVDKNGGDPVPIASGYAARWSPGGTMLVLLRGPEKNGSNGSVWLATADGKQFKIVVAADKVMRGAAWLPSGRGIVASYMRDGSYSIFRSYLDGSQPQGAPPEKIVGDGLISWSEPAVSPDGKHLMATVVGCTPDNRGNLPSAAECLADRIVILDMDTNKEVKLAGGTNYSVVWDK
jgi:Tol biopolymer transport system component